MDRIVINGAAIECLSLESIDPATGDVFARIECTPAAALPDIVARARRAQAAWSAQTLKVRCAAVRRLAQALYARRRELAQCVTRETGKPHVESLYGDVLIAIDGANYYADNAAKFLRPERVPHHNIAVKAKTGTLLFEPYGAIGIISPWNYPLAIPLGQLIPAIVAGNAVVLKPSELTPSCGALLAECFAAANLPADLIQVVQGGPAVGMALIEARPEKIVFTGSSAAGKQVAEACARLMIPSVLELGGKSPMIVLADADLPAAASAAVWGSFTNCGQACLSVERIYVEKSVAARFAELCTLKTRSLQLGPGSDPENEIGPMIRPQALERIAAQLHDAVNRGAKILTGGKTRPELGPSYFEPTVITNVDHSMLLMRDETFGPVLAIMEVDDARQGVELANDSPFGLSASIWTGDNARGRLLAAQIRCGSVMVNDVGSYFGIAEAPHGGRGASGWGRTHSRIGLMEFVQVKYLDVDRLPRWRKAWWFGYNQDVDKAANAFTDFLFAPTWRKRWRSASGAVRALLRGHRI